MPEKKLIILTHYFPVIPGEEFLIDELKVLTHFFDQVIILPNNAEKGSGSIHHLPSNVSVHYFDGGDIKYNNWSLLRQILPVLISEFINIESKKLFFSLFKFNLSLLKQCYLKALKISASITNQKNVAIYSYWCDDLALTGAFCKVLNPDLKFISRAHGFDVFEEQSDFNHIFFRPFQLSKLDRLWAVSQAGARHLKLKNPAYQKKIDFKYLGIQSNGSICFEETDIIRIVTCSHIRSIKRLDLLVSALRIIADREIEWHIIGDGPDLQNLKSAALHLGAKCKLVFYGHLTIDKIHELYSNKHFDFLVSLSSSEGLPVSMMEAISHGIPIIATDVGGCKEIVTETTGILIPVKFNSLFLVELIINCKKGRLNSLIKRQEIVDFWKENFYSKINYSKFAKEILALNDN